VPELYKLKGFEIPYSPLSYSAFHIGYNPYRAGTKTMAVRSRDVIQLSIGPQKLND